MTSVILACLWVILAQLIAFLPSRDQHWRAAYFLIAVGVPVVAYLWWENGWLYAGVALLAGGSILRWPVYYGWLRIRSLIGGSPGSSDG